MNRKVQNRCVCVSVAVIYVCNFAWSDMIDESAAVAQTTVKYSMERIFHRLRN